MTPASANKPVRPEWQRRYSAIECVAIALDFRRGGRGGFVTLWQHGSKLRADLPTQTRGERQ